VAATRSLKLNPRFDWKGLREWARDGYKDGTFSSDSVSHVLWHELAHAHMAKQRPEFFANVQGGRIVLSDAQRRLALQVSSYAGTSPVEFVSEVFAGRCAGKTYPPEVMALYRKFGGWER
jgi:hypothetical protein